CRSEDRFRQFAAVARLLREVCLQAPLLVVLDDAHWADEASLLLLHHVTRVLTDERLLLVVNARDTERDDALLARIGREPVTRRIQLRGLAPPAIRRQLASVLGREGDEREVLETEALTGGNPFFVGEVALAIADRRQERYSPAATRNVQDAI